jgi:hypothetical protein
MNGGYGYINTGFPQALYPAPVAVNTKSLRNSVSILNPADIKCTLSGNCVASRQSTQIQNRALPGAFTMYPPMAVMPVNPIEIIKNQRSVELELDIKMDYKEYGDLIKPVNDTARHAFCTFFNIPDTNGSCTPDQFKEKVKIKSYNEVNNLEMIVEKVCRDIMNKSLLGQNITFIRSVKVKKNDSKVTTTIEFNSFSCKLKFYAMVCGNLIGNYSGFWNFVNGLPTIDLASQIGINGYMTKAEDKVKELIILSWKYFITKGMPRDSSEGGSNNNEIKQLFKNNKFRKECIENERQTYSYLCDRLLKKMCTKEIRRNKPELNTYLDVYTNNYNVVQYLNKESKKYE